MPAYLPSHFASPQAYWNYVTLTLQRHEREAPWREQYAYLRAYYWNNGLYDVVRKALRGLGLENKDTQSIRNPAYRVVEFYAAKLWPGPLERALPLQTDNEAIVKPIEQLWEWSNWGTEKQTYARWFPMLGDSFVKCNAVRRPDGTGRVFMQNIDPEHVSDFEADERGFLTYIRLDIPQTEVAEGITRHLLLTEIWDKLTWRVYQHELGYGADEDKLGAPIRSGSLADLGIDFVPFVWQPFRAAGDERGANAYIAQLDKIDEANRQASRLSEMLFRHNRALWALQANATDSAGRPVPAPKIAGADSDDHLEVEDDTIFRIPGNGSLTALVPPINYSDALAVLKDQMAELREDMPELAYYALREAGADSGRAIRIKLDDAYERGNEARSMAEHGLVRAHQMCLTLGKNLGLPLFQSVGDFENGDFKHSFRERPIFPPDEFEDAQTVQTYVSAGVPVKIAAKRVGWTQEEIKELVEAASEEREENARLEQAALDAARQRFDQENNGGSGGAQNRAQTAQEARSGDEGLQTGVR